MDGSCVGRFGERVGSVRCEGMRVRWVEEGRGKDEGAESIIGCGGEDGGAVCGPVDVRAISGTGGRERGADHCKLLKKLEESFWRGRIGTGAGTLGDRSIEPAAIPFSLWERATEPA